MASFALSLEASYRLLSSGPRVNFSNAFSAGRRASRRLRLSRSGITFFLGNRALYAISIYATAKLYEFFGARALCQRLEEFCHMELFSLKTGDAVNIFEGFDPMKIGRTLAKSLADDGYDSSLAATGRLGKSESVFAALFATQLAVLRWARESNMVRPYLSRARRKLALSDSMIY